MSAAAEQVFREVDVAGDGNCFYRALYKAAKYHPDASVFGRVLACFGIELDAATSSNSNSSSAGKKSKSKSKTKKVKVKTDRAEESAFATAIRESLAAKVADDLFEVMEAADSGHTYKAWHGAALEAIGDSPFRWQAALDEAAFELADPFVERDEEGEIVEYKPEVMAAMSEADFKALVASIISEEGVYASELDYTFIKFLLNQCGIILMSVDLRPERPENVANLRVERAGRPLLFVRRMRAANHYRAVITNEQYQANKSKIYSPKSSADKVTVSGLMKVATTKKAKVSSKSKTKSKSKGAAAASNSENNLAAALAASLEKM